MLGYKSSLIHARISHLLSLRALAFFSFYQRLFFFFFNIESHHSVIVSLLDSKTSKNLHKDLLSPHERCYVLPEKLKMVKLLNSFCLQYVRWKKTGWIQKQSVSLPIVTLTLQSRLFPKSCKLVQLCIAVSNQLLKGRLGYWRNTFLKNSELLIPISSNSPASSLCFHTRRCTLQAMGRQSLSVGNRLWFGSILFAIF